MQRTSLKHSLESRRTSDCTPVEDDECCYNCMEACLRKDRRKVFCDRWQLYCDRYPRLPNTDYTVYSCKDYFDLGRNNDYLKYDHFLPLREGPRTSSLRNFLYMKNLALENREYKRPFFDCGTYEHYYLYSPPVRKDPLGVSYEKRQNLYNEEAITRWRELRSGRPEYKGFVEGSTPFNSRSKVFRRDASFTNPVDTFTGFSSGNDPPFKEFRALKML